MPIRMRRIGGGGFTRRFYAVPPRGNVCHGERAPSGPAGHLPL